MPFFERNSDKVSDTSGNWTVTIAASDIEKSSETTRAKKMVRIFSPLLYQLSYPASAVVH